MMTDEEIKKYEKELKTRMLVREFKYQTAEITVIQLSDGVYFRWLATNIRGGGYIAINRKYEQIKTDQGHITKEELSKHIFSSREETGEFIDYIPLDAEAVIVTYAITNNFFEKDKSYTVRYHIKRAEEAKVEERKTDIVIDKLKD